MAISVVTPWSGSTAGLIQDYHNATAGAEIITVDNASDEQTAAILREMHEHVGGVYLRNEINVGFAAGNNQGYAKASGDIIVFLNSDVAGDAPSFLRAVEADVKDGALYGPSLGYQLVAGRHLPYIEGWCIAATRATWERLHVIIGGESTLYPGEPGVAYGIHLAPWDQLHYPGPYWEDNDLCLRAVQAGISLVQTHWPIQHKGGQTAGPLLRHGESFARNERTFTDRVLQTFKGSTPNYTPTYLRYLNECVRQSDMQHHLPLLYSLAHGNVLELGTRTGVSTAALLAGVEARGGHVWSVDVDDCSALFAGHPQWTFIQADSRDANTIGRAIGPVVMGNGFGLALIDTIHTIEQVSAELELWSAYMAPGGTICIHDPETFPGVRRAVTEFCMARGWGVTFVLPCNGMAVISVPDAFAAPVSIEDVAWAMEAQP